jgi:hypothetical protein
MSGQSSVPCKEKRLAKEQPGSPTRCPSERNCQSHWKGAPQLCCRTVLACHGEQSQSRHPKHDMSTCVKSQPSMHRIEKEQHGAHPCLLPATRLASRWLAVARPRGHMAHTPCRYPAQPGCPVVGDEWRKAELSCVWAAVYLFTRASHYKCHQQLTRRHGTAACLLPLARIKAPLVTVTACMLGGYATRHSVCQGHSNPFFKIFS